MDLTLVANEPLELTVDGKTYRFYAGTVRQMAKLQAWVASQVPPRAPRPPLPPDVDRATANAIRASQDRAEAAVRKEWPPEPGSLDVWKFVASTEGGMAKLLELAMQKGNPNVTTAETDALLDVLAMPQLQQIAVRFFGWDAQSEADRPKADAGDGMADGTTSPTTDSASPTDAPAGSTGSTP